MKQKPEESFKKAETQIETEEVILRQKQNQTDE